MSRKIVAIGGGENGRLKPDGTRYPYETEIMDREIVSLTDKEKPNFLLIAHSQKPQGEKRYYDTMTEIYGTKYGCPCKNLLAEDLTNREKVKELVDWADIIYEGGGDTQTMIELWHRTGFDNILYQAWLDGKVMCGVSAGAMCWFNSGVSDSLRIQLNNDYAPFIDVECLDFINAMYTPHCDEQGRLDGVKDMLSHKQIVGLSVSNCAALEIVDDKYKVIINDKTDRNIKPFIQKSYWYGDKYISKNLDKNDEFGSLENLLKKD